MGALRSLLGVLRVLPKSWFLEAKVLKMRRRLGKKHRKLWLGAFISSAFVNTVNLCAGERRNGKKNVINSPEKLVEEKRRGVDSKVQLLKGCSFHLDQWYITRGPRCQGQHCSDTFPTIVYTGYLLAVPMKHTV